MHINELKNVTIADIVKDYVDNSENDEGISGFGGNLNIRPKYQRNYVYNSEQRAAVIRTLAKGFPLGIMYWVKNNDGKYEILDGQQRTISICQYVAKKRQRFFCFRFIWTCRPIAMERLNAYGARKTIGKEAHRL